MDNPLELEIREALNKANISFMEDGEKGKHGATRHLDFYLPEYDIYIEVCAYHTPRKVEQMSRADNVILLQGRDSVRFFAQRILQPPQS